jgi:glycosyltransferase involved in cell wall biosynthesis
MIGKRETKIFPGLVSIVLTTKNGARTLTKTLDSISKQTYKNYELIAVDNHSTDETPRLLGKYARVYNCSGGLANQLNFGLALAKGEYILLLEQDHTLPRDLLERCVYDLERGGYDALIVPESREGSYWMRCRILEVELYRLAGDVGSRFFRSRLLDQMEWFDQTLKGLRDYDFGYKMEQVTDKFGYTTVQIGTSSDDSLSDYVRKFYIRGSAVSDMNARYGASKILAPYLYALFHPFALRTNPNIKYLPGFFLLKTTEFFAIFLAIMRSA